jgi:hypothetical protein
MPSLRQGAEGQAGQGRTESGVLAETGMRAEGECPPGFGTRAREDADMRRSTAPWTRRSAGKFQTKVKLTFTPSGGAKQAKALSLRI